jgi:hypothetical protein
MKFIVASEVEAHINAQPYLKIKRIMVPVKDKRKLREVSGNLPRLLDVLGLMVFALRFLRRTTSQRSLTSREVGLLRQMMRITHLDEQR